MFFFMFGNIHLKTGSARVNDNIQISHYCAELICFNRVQFFVIGVIGMPPGVVYGAPVFPGQLLTPMMQPRFR